VGIKLCGYKEYDISEIEKTIVDLKLEIAICLG
jgi:hypothetical protein